MDPSEMSLAPRKYLFDLNQLKPDQIDTATQKTALKSMCNEK
jgi:hypothetical protein